MKVVSRSRCSYLFNATTDMLGHPFPLDTPTPNRPTPCIDETAETSPTSTERRMTQEAQPPCSGPPITTRSPGQYSKPTANQRGGSQRPNNGGAGYPTPTCRETRRLKEPNVDVSQDAKAQGAHRQRVARHEGMWNPLPTCRKARRHGEPNPNKSKGTKHGEPNADVLQDTKAWETHCPYVERHDGMGHADMSKDTKAYRTTRGGIGEMTLLVFFLFPYSLLIKIYFYVPKHIAKEESLLCTNKFI